MRLNASMTLLHNGLPDFLSIIVVWPLADVKPMLFDLIHAVPWQCMIALSLGIPGYLWPFECHFTITLSVIC